MKTIRRQLIVGVLITVLPVVGSLIVYIYNKTLHEIDEVFDAELSQTAGMIADLVLADLDSRGENRSISNPASRPRKHPYEANIGYEVWENDVLLLHSRDMPILSSDVSKDFSTMRIAGVEWRLFRYDPPGTNFHIYTGVNNEARQELALEISGHSLKILLWSLPLLLVMVSLMVRRGLAPLESLSRQVRSQDIDRLAPIDCQAVPGEVVPLVEALNELLQRLHDTLEHERRFTADASHELRTPLSSIRLHSQLALAADSEETREQALQAIIEAVDQSSHLIEQLLLLGRLPMDRSLERPADVDLGRICEQLIDLLKPLAEQRDITLETRLEDLPHLQSNAELLSAMLRNLLDNAIRYTPPGSRVLCRSMRTGTKLVLEILDEGPGIPEDRIHWVTRRFVRLAGQDIQGCGLGLSIVSLAAEQLGITLTLKNRRPAHPGLAARLEIPLDPSPDVTRAGD